MTPDARIPPLDADQQLILEEVVLHFARDLPDAADLSEPCKIELISIFHDTILKGLAEVGANQWKERKAYAYHRIATWARYIKKRQVVVSQITPADLRETLQELSETTQKAMKRLDPSIEEFIGAFPKGASDQEKQDHMNLFFPFCPPI